VDSTPEKGRCHGTAGGHRGRAKARCTPGGGPPSSRRTGAWFIYNSDDRQVKRVRFDGHSTRWLKKSIRSRGFAENGSFARTIHFVDKAANHRSETRRPLSSHIHGLRLYGK
jgi:hypothetical protein